VSAEPREPTVLEKRTNTGVRASVSFRNWAVVYSDSAR